LGSARHGGTADLTKKNDTIKNVKFNLTNYRVDSERLTTLTVSARSGAGLS